jgi:hypothetical protein
VSTSKERANQLEKDAEALAMQDRRYEPLLGPAYAVDPTPGRHK